MDHAISPGHKKMLLMVLMIPTNILRRKKYNFLVNEQVMKNQRF